MAIAECVTVIVISHALVTPSAFWSCLSRSTFIFEDPQAISNIRMSSIRVLGALMMLVGGSLRLLTFRTLGKFFTFEVGVQKDHRLITAFPYSIVRHPAYAATLLTHPGCLFCSLAQGGWLRESGVLTSWVGMLYFGLYGFFVVSFPFIMVVRMKQEEEMLRKKFGKEWEDWAKRVRFMLLPGVY
ncbi:hypothetical protein BJ165DRAFT_1511098 [Panaeolus papilionaceus]|nr:hypothetical protein BJ165DRAFT_1511098 [Panaeolus papilionaceus]